MREPMQTKHNKHVGPCLYTNIVRPKKPLVRVNFRLGMTKEVIRLSASHPTYDQLNQSSQDF
jgi:hypothetical protein